MNAGGPAYTDKAGNVWRADEYFQAVRGAQHTVANAIANTDDDALFQSERWWMDGYRIPIANGSYTLKLSFAEISPASGTRVFSVRQGDRALLADFNIAREVGNYAALVKQFQVDVTGGVLDLRFTSTSNAASIAAIELLQTTQQSATTTTVRPAATTSTFRVQHSGKFLALDNQGRTIQSSVATRFVVDGSALRVGDRCLDTNILKEARPSLVACNSNDPGQKWDLTAPYISPVGSSFTLDVERAGTQDGSVVELWDKYNSANQRWTRIKAAAPPTTIAPAPATSTTTTTSRPPTTVQPSHRLPELGFSLNGEGLSGPLSQEHYNNLADITPGTVWARLGYSSDGDWRANADKGFNAATKAGMKVLLRASFKGNEFNSQQPVNVDAYGNFVAEMAARYKGKGVGGTNPVIELPNEINGTKIAGATYAAAACNAYPKLKAVDPNYKLIGASENVYASNWKTWLTDVYQGGFAKCSDGVSFHNYDAPGDGARYSFLRQTMTQYKDLDAMVWLTEFGATTCPNVTGSSLGCQTEQKQADKIVGNLKDLRDNYPWITHAFIYADEDIPSRKQSDPFEAYFGIYRNDANGTITGEKPAAKAVRDLYR